MAFPTYFNCLRDELIAINIQALLLRFVYMFFLICLPLLREAMPNDLRSLPMVGLSGLICVALALFSNAGARLLCHARPAVNTLCGALLLVLFNGVWNLYSPRLLLLFAITLGVASVCTEFSALSCIVESQTNLRSQMSAFNFLRVLGIAAGLFLGCGVASGARVARLSGLLVAGVGATLIILASTSSRYGVVRSVSHTAIEFERSSASKGLFGATLIVLDLVAFTVLLSYVPAALDLNSRYGTVLIGLCMAVQALAHAFGQLFWKQLVSWLGDITSFAISLLGNATMIVVITQTRQTRFAMTLALFVLTGIVNSGTYLSSTNCYYSALFPRSKHARVAIHHLASNIGKWVGAMIVGWLMANSQSTATRRGERAYVGGIGGARVASLVAEAGNSGAMVQSL